MSANFIKSADFLKALLNTPGNKKKKVKSKIKPVST